MSLKFVLLTLLHREQATGYEIVKSFDQAVGYFWSASHQQVYRELSKLADTALVKFTEIEQGDKPDKKVYRITGAGERELHDWLGKPAASPPTKDLLLVKLLNLRPDTVELLLEELDIAIDKAIERQNIYLEIEKTYYSKAQVASLELKDLAVYLALRKGISNIESHIDWLRQSRSTIAKRGKSSS